MGKYAPILRIAELGNLTRAADDLGYSQSSLSYITSTLEKELGVKLFYRERQGVTLTEAGADLVKIMREIEQLETKLQTTALSHRTGVLRIGAFTSIITMWLPDLLKEFYKKFPNTTVHVIQRDRYDDLSLCLQRGEVDCTFFAGKHSAAWDFFPLYNDEYYVVTAKDHPLAQHTAIQAETLQGYTFLPPSETLGHNPMSDLYEQLGVSCNLSTQIQEDSVILKLVESGFGFTILPGLPLVEQAKGRQVSIIPFSAPPKYRSIGLLCRPFDDLSDVARFFLQLTKTYVAQWTEDHYPSPL